jgi:predicted DNA-binding protein (UPF0278 family)
MTDEELVTKIRNAVATLTELITEAAIKNDIAVVMTPTIKKTDNEVLYWTLHIDAFIKRLDKPLFIVPK